MPERYLTPLEYRRLARVLADDEAAHPIDVAIVRLLIFTGARSGEIQSLKWGEVSRRGLALGDSKTGQKFVYLNSQAAAVLASLRGETVVDNDALIFPLQTKQEPRNIGPYWATVRTSGGYTRRPPT